jgi:8-oxo-dGTP pyrophosphatase MutT (NUDIX family)
MDTLIQDLRLRLQLPLPGRPAQLKMATLRRVEELDRLGGPPPDARVACTLQLLYRNETTWHTLLIQRAANPRDRHGGQISFPGGSVEEGDIALENAALREAEEEIGVSADQIVLVGRLTELYIPVSNFVVHPFVGILKGPARFRPQPGEVDAILTPPLHVFYHPDNRKRTNLSIGPGITLKDVPYFDVEGRVVWGATAMIISEFLELFPEGFQSH